MLARLNQSLKPLWIALQFFTVVPVPRYGEPSSRDLANSVLFYPLVGFLLGGILYASAILLDNYFSNSVVAALLLCLWVVISGMLHLDGLADCADAWVGGLGSRDRTLSIMKDPRSGPVAVVLLVVLLLLKFTLIETLLSQQAAIWIIAAPVVGRMAAVLLFLTTDYVRTDGLGTVLSEQLPRPLAWTILSIVTLIALGLWPQWLLSIIVLTAVVFIGWRQMMVSRLGGSTGDTIGAMIELVELAALLAIAAHF